MVFMKNTMKCLEAMRSIAAHSRWLCAIAIAAVIGFSFAACELPIEAPTLTGITAVYTGGSVSLNTDVNSLKSNLTVTAQYSDNTNKTLDVADYLLSGDLSASGQKTITVIYAGKTTFFTVTVTAVPNSDITYTAIQTGGADKTDDNNGADSTGIVFAFTASIDSLNMTADDITVDGTAAKGTAATFTKSGTNWLLSPITVSAAGTATVSINKTGIEAETKHVTVYKAGETALTGITAVYAQGAAIIYPTTPLDDLKAGLTVTAQYSEGDEETLSENEYILSISGGTLTVGTSTVTVSYEGEETTFTVTVTAPETVTAPALTGITAVYTQGSTIIYSNTPLNSLKANLTVEAQYSDGSENTLSENEYTLSGTLTVGTSTVTVTYQGKTAPFTVTVTASGNSRNEAIELTENLWADGNIPTSDGQQWFKFTATASPQYIHVNIGTLTMLNAQMYDSRGVMMVGREAIIYSNKSTPESLTPGQTYYIRVMPFNSDYRGTYWIAFTASTAAPNRVQIPSDAIPLTENQLADGSLPTSSDVQWFTFTATAATQYIHAAFGTLTSLYVIVYDSDSAVVGGGTNLSGSTTYTLRTLTTGQTYYISVRPYGSRSGTYRIGFNTSIVPLDAIPLIADQWADGNLLTTNDVQWFVFTATASTQCIHAAFGTLLTGALYVQVYDSSGAAVGSETVLYRYTTYTSRSLTAGQTYYIRVRPESSFSGAYRIAFNAAAYPPGTSLIPLTENQWADGSLLTPNDYQWFTFTATVPTQYIHVTFGTLVYLSVQVYDSSGATVGSSEVLSQATTTRTSRSLTAGQTYYIKIEPYILSGTYRIGFNRSIEPTGTTNPIPLTENQWADGNIPTSGDVQWFTFTAAASTQYIHISFGTLTAPSVQVYDSSGATVGSPTSSSGTTAIASISLTETYFIKVTSYSDSGTYRITFTATAYPPGTSFIPLTENQWANGSLPTSNDQQWYTFTATASMQYIHVSFGTLNNLYVQVYNSSGATVGNSTALYSSNPNTSRSLTVGQTYYIRVTPLSGAYSGAYQIGFTISTTVPVLPSPSNAIPLTENQWADGSLPTSSDVQWSTFTATASTQYIHVSSITLALRVSVYNSSGAAVLNEKILDNTNTSILLTAGQTYYIRVSQPSFSNIGGAYRIGFTTSTTAPTS
jgi:hypothetical protein